MKTSAFSRPSFALASAAMLFVIFVPPSSAAVKSAYQIGSANTVTADPSVPRPSTTPCAVQLFRPPRGGQVK